MNASLTQLSCVEHFDAVNKIAGVAPRFGGHSSLC